MDVRVSSCYYHVERPSVATCEQCGVGVCKECAVRDDFGRIICYRCGNRKLKQEQKEYREMLKQQGGMFRNGTEFIVPGIIGALLVIVCFLVYFIGYIGSFEILFGIIEEDKGFLISGIMLAYILFSIPFCMTMLNGLFAPRYDHTLIGDIWLVLKFCFSMAAGWIVFTFYWIRFIVTKAKLKKE